MAEGNNKEFPCFDDKDDSITLKGVYENQKQFQRMVIDKYGYDTKDSLVSLPTDSVGVASFHMQALMEEVGELVKSDKRWKNFRNKEYDKDNKLEELADCFICLMNICLFSGVRYYDLEAALVKKLKGNYQRVQSEDSTKRKSK